MLEICACIVVLPIVVLVEVVNDLQQVIGIFRSQARPCTNSLRFLRSPRAMVIPSLLIFTEALSQLTARRAATIEPTIQKLIIRGKNCKNFPWRLLSRSLTDLTVVSP